MKKIDYGKCRLQHNDIVLESKLVVAGVYLCVKADTVPHDNTLSHSHTHTQPSYCKHNPIFPLRQSPVNDLTAPHTVCVCVCAHIHACYRAINDTSKTDTHTDSH